MTGTGAVRTTRRPRSRIRRSGRAGALTRKQDPRALRRIATSRYPLRWIAGLHELLDPQGWRDRGQHRGRAVEIRTRRRFGRLPQLVRGEHDVTQRAADGMRLGDDLEQDDVAVSVGEERQVGKNALGMRGPIKWDKQGRSHRRVTRGVHRASPDRVRDEYLGKHRTNVAARSSPAGTAAIEIALDVIPSHWEARSASAW